MVKRTTGILILVIIINLSVAAGFSYAKGKNHVYSPAKKLSLKNCKI